MKVCKSKFSRSSRINLHQRLNLKNENSFDFLHYSIEREFKGVNLSLQRFTFFINMFSPYLIHIRFENAMRKVKIENTNKVMTYCKQVQFYLTEMFFIINVNSFKFATETLLFLFNLCQILGQILTKCLKP